MERAWSVRAYKDGDEAGILELLKVIFKKTPNNKEWWKWRYINNPAGASIIWLAEHDGKIVGHYAIIPMKMVIGEETVISSLAIDIATHPDYRRQRIFETLAKKAHNEAEKKGVYMCYVFPNKYSYPGFIKMGWLDVCSLPILIKPLNLENILKKYIKNKFLLNTCVLIIGDFIVNTLYRTKPLPKIDNLTITEISYFDNRIDDFCDEICHDHEIMVIRNKEYLNWRYVDIPSVNYTIYIAEKKEKICGYIILRCEEREGRVYGDIYDIIAPLGQEDVFYLLVFKAIEYFKEKKVDLIRCRMVAEKKLLKIFRKNGFIFSNLINKQRVCASAISSKLSKKYLKNPDNWLIQAGDSDLYK